MRDGGCFRILSLSLSLSLFLSLTSIILSGKIGKKRNEFPADNSSTVVDLRKEGTDSGEETIGKGADIISRTTLLIDCGNSVSSFFRVFLACIYRESKEAKDCFFSFESSRDIIFSCAHLSSFATFIIVENFVYMRPKETDGRKKKRDREGIRICLLRFILEG